MKRKSGQSSRKRGPIKRTPVVWASLLGAMTTVGGVLFALDGKATTRVDGLALPALVSASGSSSIETVFRTRAPLDTKRWRSIVIHHSGSMRGTPASLEAQAKSTGLKGLGAHFVIGNGQGMDDGEIHVGYRWLDQTPGAHSAGKDADWYNLHAIGICSVGNGDRQEFTPAQIDRLRGDVRKCCAASLTSPRSVWYCIARFADVGPGTAVPDGLVPRATSSEAIASRIEPSAWVGRPPGQLIRSPASRVRLGRSPSVPRRDAGTRLTDSSDRFLNTGAVLPLNFLKGATILDDAVSD